jgi:hypothetical protein
MNTIHFIKSVALLLLSCAIFGCEKESNPSGGGSVNGSGSIYGCVTDFATGEPVRNANVQLRPSGETTLTGYDGIYEFLDITDGNYSNTVSKAEYTDLIDDYVIEVKNGRRMRRDVQIEKIPTWIRLTNMAGHDITELDFGSNSSINMQSFNIYNNGTVSISCGIVYSCEWITSVSSVPSTLNPGQNVTVSVYIDRSKLAAGLNSTDLYVTSNNGSNVLHIKATGGYALPDVTTKPVTYVDGTITPWCNTFHAEVTSVGNPAYHKRGFCYSSTNHTPTINDNRIDVSGTGLGEYSYTYWDFPPNTVTYYVRAWVMYGSNNKIQYGNVRSFTYNNVK